MNTLLNKCHKQLGCLIIFPKGICYHLEGLYILLVSSGCYKNFLTLPIFSLRISYVLKNNFSYILTFYEFSTIIFYISDELRQFLKDCKYLEHVMSKSIFNAKLQCPAPNSEREKNIIPPDNYYPNIDSKSLTQRVKNKFENIRNGHFNLYINIRISYHLSNNKKNCIENWHLEIYIKFEKKKTRNL